MLTSVKKIIAMNGKFLIPTASYPNLGLMEIQRGNKYKDKAKWVSKSMVNIGIRQQNITLTNGAFNNVDVVDIYVDFEIDIIHKENIV